MLKSVAKDIFNKLGYEIRNKNEALQVYYEEDKAFHDLYEKAQKRCQMTNTDNILRRQRHYTLNQLLRNAPLKKGDVCELGCWRGLSSYQIASYLCKRDNDIAFHIFDSFEGLSSYEDVDIPKGNTQGLEQKRKQFTCSLEAVRENLKEFSFVKYHKGWIPERFNDVENKTFSFVHIDVDLYQPIYDSFQFFYSRMVKGGIMVFDDYGYIQFPGAKKAVDLNLNDLKNPFFIH